MSNFVKFTEIRERPERGPTNERKYELSEVVLNSKHVTLVRDGSDLKRKMKSRRGWPEGLDERIFITEVLMNFSTDEESNIYLVGDFNDISKKFGGVYG